MHNGSGLPPGHGAEKGNTRAEGNPGGGAPPGNNNNRIHGGFQDVDQFEEELNEDEEKAVRHCAREWYEKSEDTAPDDMTDDERWELCWRYWVLYYQGSYADADLANHPDSRGVAWTVTETYVDDDGEEIEVKRTKANPAWEASFRLRSRRRKIEGRLNLSW